MRFWLVTIVPLIIPELVHSADGGTNHSLGSTLILVCVPVVAPGTLPIRLPAT